MFRKIFTDSVCTTRSIPNFLLNNARMMCKTVEVRPSERNSKKEAESEGHVLIIPKAVVGQPTCHTHPHLVQPGHLTCGVKQEEYIDRRDTLMNKLIGEVENVNTHHIVVIPGAVKKFMSDQIPYPFRQNSDFYYLTGCLEPGAILVLVKPPMTDNYKATLFVNEKDAHAEMWEGPRTGCVNAMTLFAVNECCPIDAFPTYLQQVTKDKPGVVWYNADNSANPSLNPELQKLTHEKSSFVLADPMKAIHEMRVVKSPAEIELMRETCYIGAQAMNMAMACTKPGISEHTINAVLEFTARQGGAEYLAFPPVVAGGPRATHIHYINNNQLLDEKEMVLTDAGSQRWLYNSDLTRTWPVSGRFSNYQRILYELVLSVQKRLIQLLGERQQPLDQLFDQMCRLLGMHLQQEGILKRDLDSNEVVARAYRLCPHHVSHYLGLDVHDSHLVRRNVPLQPGMVVTVEPGLYIRENDKTVPEEFRGMGIRIEDDVLITSGGPQVLTDSCVKEVDDVEAIVGRHKV